ncbi:MAG TPA: hypothetical protein ENH06_00370 [bacterium]|nr:hypothetical protein [bacterium]
MSIFKDKKEFTRSKFRQILKKSSSKIPGSNKTFASHERIKLERSLFPYRKYGSYISESDTKRAIQDLKVLENKTKIREERLKINRQRRFLEKIIR